MTARDDYPTLAKDRASDAQDALDEIDALRARIRTAEARPEAITAALDCAVIEQRGQHRGVVIPTHYGSVWCESVDSIISTLRAAVGVRDTPNTEGEQ